MTVFNEQLEKLIQGADAETNGDTHVIYIDKNHPVD
jgi:hypothetical protein